MNVKKFIEGGISKVNLIKAVIMLTVFISAFMLFFIFDRISRLKEECSTSYTKICERLKGEKFTVFIILLFVSGFTFIILFSAYILISAHLVEV